MFRCWNCGNDYPDVPYASKAESGMWEDRAVKDEHKKIHQTIDNYRKELIESSMDVDEYQQGLMDGLWIALALIGE